MMAASPSRMSSPVSLGSICALGNQDAATGFAGQRGFDDSLGQSTLGEVVSCGDQSVTRGGEQDVRKQLLTGEVDLRRHATEVTVLDLRPDGAVELVVGVAEQDRSDLCRKDSARESSAGELVG